MRGSRPWCAIIVCALVVACPREAAADAGSPLLWAEGFHLILGNLLISVLEAAILQVVFRSRWNTIGWMLAANTASTVVGLVITGVPAWTALQHALLGSEPLYRLRLAVIGLVGVSFLLTIVVEWPFVKACLAPGRSGWRRAFVASVVVQAASYAILVPFYGCAVADTDWIPDPGVLAERPSAATVAYTSPSGERRRIRLDGTGDTPVPADEAPPPGFDVRRMTWNLPAWDLQESHGAVAVWDKSRSRTWVLGLQTPIVKWNAHPVALLPGDKGVFEFGPQIVVVDLPTGRTAFLAKGHHAVAELDAAPPDPPRPLE